MKTATPAMARAINDRLALDLLLERGPLTAPQLRTLTGLSRPTVSDLIERLMVAGLIEVTGEYGEDRRGPNARLYGLVADRAHVAGVDLRRSAVNVTVADITGEVVGKATRAIDDSASPGTLAALIVDAVTAAAGKRVLETVVIGAPGLVDPRDGELISGEGEVPGWRRGVVGSVRQRLGLPVVLENEVNLAAIAELRKGAARGSEDFVLLWLDDGVGAAVVLGGRLRRGASGGAGEIGFLDISGVPYCDLVEARVLRGLGRSEVVHRIAKGAFAFATLLDPGLVVLGGKTGHEGGDELAALVSERLRELAPAPTEVRASTVEGNAVLQGAVLTALDLTRDRVFG
ncbi:ROK family transcriptional regulator [Nonomuraea turcica]|uniref:ROK family transcriptional regulator n=1 Tax=Nonomuraea sp. G32 TaxID=3067274 RepID=UPI00273AA9A7|nr:ROK family transcriptional regulator [Nonomuraea sp. G32]MDP4509507.1 ROK family transcriptional regulator [Nonomuraea sp. G32]